MEKNVFSMQHMRENARIQPMGVSGGGKSRLLFHFSIFGVAFCISCLYQGMRPIMRLGGMVASGGPYAIAHPAPHWVWIIPLSIIFGLVCFFLNLFTGTDDGGINLMPLAWPGLFLSLGWNFLEFAFAPPAGGVAWGWLVCGVFFALMGGLPLWLALRAAGEKIKRRLRERTAMAMYLLQWLLVAIGVGLGIIFFRGVAA